MSAVVPEKFVDPQNSTSSQKPAPAEKSKAEKSAPEKSAAAKSVPAKSIPEKSGSEKSGPEKSAPEKSGPQKPAGAGGYSVVRALGKCHVCAADIAPGTKLMTALRETPESLVRMDV